MTKYRRYLLLSVAVIVPLGLLSKFYRGVGQEWLTQAFGGVPYEIFWMMVVALIWTHLRPIAIALIVFIATASVEFLQLWQPDWLQAIRTTLPGRLVLGNTFAWSDFPYYAIGCWVGWLWLRWLTAVSQEA